MNSQMERPRGHSTTHEQRPHDSLTVHSGHEGHDDDTEHQHGEKKSVLKKVKAKAKKIKDTIKGHVGHGHDHNHDRDSNEDDDHEVDHQHRQTHPQSQVLHGAPGHPSRGARRNAIDEVCDVPTSQPRGYHTFDPTYQSKSSGGGTNSSAACVLSTGLLEGDVVLERDPHAPKDVGERTDAENYQTKVTDPTGMGSKEVEVTPILHQLDKMIIHDQPNSQNPNQTVPNTASSYGEAISNVTAKISETAAKAKDAVATKLGYSAAHKGEHESAGTGYIGEYGRKVAEKLKPGEEDKALYEVITEALPLHKGNEEEAGKGGEGGVKLGRVTESEEVTKRLGPFKELNEEKMGSEFGKEVVHWMKETTAWCLGSSQGSSNDDPSKGSSHSNSDGGTQR